MIFMFDSILIAESWEPKPHGTANWWKCGSFCWNYVAHAQLMVSGLCCMIQSRDCAQVLAWVKGRSMNLTW